MQKDLLNQADKLREQAIALQKQKTAGAGN